MSTARPRPLHGLAPAALVMLTSLAGRAPADEPPTYERDVRPLLAKRCTICHNIKEIDDEEVSAGLALDSFEAIREGSKEHTVLVPGRAGESALYGRLIDEDEDRRMPLGEPPLADAQRALIRRWIDSGAPRGEPVASAEPSAPAPAPRRIVRTLDVVLPTAATLTNEAAGAGPGGKVEVVLKVGPLPGATALAFRGDGRQLAVGTYGRVTVWDLRDGRPAATREDLPGPVHALAFAPDGRRLFVGTGEPGRSGEVRIFAVPDGTPEAVLEGHTDVVFALAVRGDGRQLASAGLDGRVRLWDLPDGRLAGVFEGHSDLVYDVAYTPDGRAVLSAGKDRSIKQFDPATARGGRTYSDHNAEILALAVRPDGKGFVTAGEEPQLRWWDLDADKPARRVGGHSGPVDALAFSGDGTRLISAGADKTVRLWDGATGSAQKTLPGPTEWQYAAALSADGHLAAAGGWDGLVRLWDADSGKLLATLLQPPSPSPGTPDWMALAPDGALAASDSLSPLVRWRAGGAEIPREAGEAAFFKPDALAQTLRGGPEGDAEP